MNDLSDIIGMVRSRTFFRTHNIMYITLYDIKSFEMIFDLFSGANQARIQLACGKLG